MQVLHRKVSVMRDAACFVTELWDLGRVTFSPSPRVVIRRALPCTLPWNFCFVVVEPGGGGDSRVSGSEAGLPGTEAWMAPEQGGRELGSNCQLLCRPW